MGRVRKHRSAAHLLPARLSVAYLQIHIRPRDPKSTLTYAQVSDIEAAELASRLWERCSHDITTARKSDALESLTGRGCNPRSVPLPRFTHRPDRTLPGGQSLRLRLRWEESTRARGERSERATHGQYVPTDGCAFRRFSAIWAIVLGYLLRLTFRAKWDRFADRERSTAYHKLSATGEKSDEGAAVASRIGMNFICCTRNCRPRGSYCGHLTA
jgi:hypothetical protein